MKIRFFRYLEHTIISCAVVAMFLFLHQIFAWTNPTQNPPGGTGVITTLSNGNVGIGTANPGAKLEVAGQVKITGGAPGANKILTSDAAGLATWQTPSTSSGIPSGTIVMWSGNLASIPAGWHLADGTNGTPDLRDRFILGVSSGESPGATGGANSYSLSVSQLPAHSHGFTTSSAGAHTHSLSTDGNHLHTLGWDFLAPYTPCCSRIGFTKGNEFKEINAKNNTNPAGDHTHTVGSAGAHTHSGSTDNGPGGSAAIDNRPAFYKLAFIMKL